MDAIISHTDPWKEKKKSFFIIKQIQLQPLQRSVMHILHLFVLKQRVFLLTFHLSLWITGLILTVTYSFILVFLSLEILNTGPIVWIC